MHSIALHLKFVESFPSLEELIEALVRTQLKQNVYVFTIFEEMLEVANILVLYTSVNFDFTHELLFCSALDEGRLLNDLRRVNVLGLGIHEFEAFGESTLSEELALQILADAN